MTLNIFNLSDDDLLEMYNSLLEADIRRHNNKDARALLKKMENQSKGRKKKIYTAMRKAKDLDLALDVFYNAIVGMQEAGD